MLRNEYSTVSWKMPNFQCFIPPDWPRHLISHDSQQENTTIENIVQAYVSARNATKFSSGSAGGKMIWKDFIHLESIKKRQKGPPHQYFCRRFVEISILQWIFSLPFIKHDEFHVYKCISLLFTTGVCYVYKVRAAKNLFFSSVNIFSLWNNRASSQHSSVDRPSKGLKRTVAAEEAARAVKTVSHCNKPLCFSRLDTDFANHFSETGNFWLQGRRNYQSVVVFYIKTNLYAVQ